VCFCVCVSAILVLWKQLTHANVCISDCGRSCHAYASILLAYADVCRAAVVGAAQHTPAYASILAWVRLLSGTGVTALQLRIAATTLPSDCSACCTCIRQHTSACCTCIHLHTLIRVAATTSQLSPYREALLRLNQGGVEAYLGAVKALIGSYWEHR
jgi:hypothetical protein